MYKKIIFMLIAAMLFSVSGCGKNDVEDDKISYKKVSSKDKKKDEDRIKTDWTSGLEVICKPNEYGVMTDFEETCKVNGKKYKIGIFLEDESEYGAYNSITLSINDSSYKLEDTYFFGLNYAALAELDGEDIILFTGFGSEDDWNGLATFRYDGKSLEPFITGVNYQGTDDLILSFSPEIDIELADYSDFKMWVWTSSRAMWKIKRTYTIRDDRIIAHQEDRYEVNIKDFLQPYASYEDYKNWHGTTEEEYDRLSDGYVMCHKYYYGLEEGTYFTVLYDNGHNDIYIRTDSGEEYWTEIPEYPEAEEISPYLFFLAG